MKILIFKHIPDEPAGHAEQWAEERGHGYSYFHWGQDQETNTLPEFDLLIIMGGKMGAYEEDIHPWLRTEKQIIRETIASGKKVMGICLGAQLIASAMGAAVYKNRHPEIGFHEISAVQPSSPLLKTPVTGSRYFQWHGDTFDLPEGACLIATSDQVKNQAFTLNDNVLALQFHPEMDEKIVQGLLDSEHHRVEPSPWLQSKSEITDQLSLVNEGRNLLFTLLDELTSSPEPGR